jgi:hypothetical protein
MDLVPKGVAGENGENDVSVVGKLDELKEYPSEMYW